VLEQYLGQFILLANGTKLSILVGMILANFLLGVGVSIYTKKFRLKALGDFLLSRVVPYIFGYFAVVVLAIIQPAWEIAVTFVWGIIVVALVGVIFANFKAMGINLPEVLAGKKE